MNQKDHFAEDVQEALNTLQNKNEELERLLQEEKRQRELSLGFKKKYEKTLALLAQVERERGDAKRQSESAEEECSSLREQQKILKNMIKQAQAGDLTHKEKLQEENVRIEKQLDEAQNALQHAVGEREQLMAQLAQQQEELKFLKLNSEGLEEHSKSSQDALTELKKELQHYREMVEKLQNEQISKDFQYLDHQKNLEEAQERIQSFQKNVKQLQCEHHELMQNYHAAKKEKAALTTKNYQLQKLLEDEKIAVKTKEAELKKTTFSENQLMEKENQCELLKIELVEAVHKGEKCLEEHQALKVSYAEKMEEVRRHEEKIQELDEALTLAQEEKRKDALEYDQSKIKIHDLETRLTEAQHHFAKKVKEVAVSNEQIEEHQEKIAELTDALKMARQEKEDALGKLDIAFHQEKRLQDQITRLEEKYFRTYEHWQESEAKAKELKILQEKHQQLQALLANLGSVIGGGTGPLQQTVHIESEDKAFDVPIPPPQVNAEPPQPKEEKLLWDMPAPPPSLKNSLFD